MIHKIGTKLERAAGGQGKGIIRGCSSWGKGTEEVGRRRITRQQFRNGEGSDVVGTKTVSERQAESSRELGW